MQTTCMQTDFVKISRKKTQEYHDLYLKSDTPQLADVFQNFSKMCLEIY